MRRYISVAAGMVLAGLFAWLLVRRLDWAVVLATIAGAKFGWLTLALLALAIDYSLRIMRWGALLRFTGARTNFQAIIPAFLAGFALNNVLPLRLGDVMRMVMVRNLAGTSVADALGTLLLERFWDLATLGVFFVFGLMAARQSFPPAFVSSAEVIATLGIAALFGVATLSGPATRFFASLAEKYPYRLVRFLALFLKALASASKPRLIGLLAVYSVLAWGVETLVLYFCARAIGLSLSGHAVGFILSAANFSALLPGTPGNVGTFHYFATVAAVSFGVGRDRAAALAILFHATMWVPITAIGGAFLATNTNSFRVARSLSSPEI